ncbi:MAG: porin [Nitrosomonadales bacterium]|nr:porin [Nitrosomonadales bacterium]
MKKKLITLAVAAAFAPAMAMAEVTVYGQAHLSLDSHSGNGGATATGTQDGMQITSNSSRLGFKGATELSNGMKALFQYEASVAGDGSGAGTIFNGTRDTFIGLGGGFGTVLAGRLPLTNQYLYDVNFFADQVGDVGNLAVVGNIVGGRVNRALAYAAPGMGGVSVLAAFVPNTQESVGAGQAVANKQSSFTLRGSYSGGPVTAALSYQSIGVAGVAATMLKDAKLTVASVSASYDFGMGKAGVQYTSNGANAEANNGGSSTTQNTITAGASFKVSDEGVVKAQFTKTAKSSVANSNDGATMMAVGYDHSMDKSTTVYVAYAKVTNDDGASFSASGWGHSGVGAPSAAGKDPSAVSVGAVYKF